MGGVQAGIEKGHTDSLRSLLLHVDVVNRHQMWEYFLLDYMASVFLNMTRRDTDKLFKILHSIPSRGTCKEKAVKLNDSAEMADW